jgi:hypothetical protein
MLQKLRRDTGWYKIRQQLRYKPLRNQTLAILLLQHRL